MSKLPKDDITRLLGDWNQGDSKALEALISSVYRDLHRLAHSYMKGERAGHVLQTTALINEAYLKITGLQGIDWKSRDHFIGTLARLMRHILVDLARSNRSQKRGGGALQMTLSDEVTAGSGSEIDLLVLDEALTELSRLDERKCKVVELRYFGGLSNQEISRALEISPETVIRDWKFSKAWLHNWMKGNPGEVNQR